MISAWICSAAWRRFDVTRLVLEQRSRLIAELAASGIQATMLIAADDENLDIAREFGAETLRIRNSPLGAKCNQMLRHAAEQADWVVWVGSDDWIHPSVFDPLDGRERPISIIRGQRLVTVNMATGALQRCTAPSAFGAIPWLIDSRMIRGKSHAPIRPDLGRGLDGSLIRGLRKLHRQIVFEDHDPHEFRCVDFKTAENLTTYAGLQENKGYGEPGTAWDELTGWFPADLIDQARALAHSS